MIRFGKPSGPLLMQKASFFRDNDKLQENIKRISEIYAAQPVRTNCKNCDGALVGRTFKKLGVDYVFCNFCGHLNGRNEDTAEFCRTVYTDNGGAAYAQVYSAEDRQSYQSRVDAIYKPKAKFLLEVLGPDARKLRYADMGAGSGYFVSALLGEGVDNVVGHEVSEAQVRLAKAMSSGTFHVHDLDDIDHLVAAVSADVISFVGVLEHLRNPREVLGAVRKNSAIKYLFLSVPMFSPTVYFEAIFPEVFHRHLSAGHTHLYTDESINWICKEFRFQRIGEWWFGTDFVDIYRDVLVSLGRNKETEALTESWHTTFCELLDSLQLELDKRKLSSEVHIILRKE